MMKKNFLWMSLVFLLLSCNKSDDSNQPYGPDAVFIVNEGPFTTGTGTIDAYNRKTGEVAHNIFEAANGRPLGNIVQSISVRGDRAFIPVHKANALEVVSLGDFTSVFTLEQVTLPRYFLPFNDQKGYLSCWDSTVKVISLTDYSIIESIFVGNGPDEMVQADDRVFVINSGGFDIDSTVSVIFTNGEELFARITVGHRPAGIQKDRNGNIWVLCSGKGWNGFPAPGDTPARLVCFDPESLAILKDFTFPDSIHHPDCLIVNSDGSQLFYNHPQGIFRHDIEADALENEPFAGSGKYFYGLGYDPESRMIYASDPVDYAQIGYIFRFLDTNGAQVDSFQAGIAPNGFWFN